MTCPQCGNEFTPKRKEQKYCSTDCLYINLRVEKRGWFAEKRINPCYSPVYANKKL
jgi:endogenous inhibitor of DNA gyrase (YacG/DUF329 family)